MANLNLGEPQALRCYISPSTGHRIQETGYEFWIHRRDKDNPKANQLVPRLFPKRDEGSKFI